VFPVVPSITNLSVLILKLLDKSKLPAEVTFPVTLSTINLLVLIFKFPSVLILPILSTINLSVFILRLLDKSNVCLK